jgi:chaperone modulatory protein CbpM
MHTSEFLVHARLDAASLDAWVAAGWLALPRDGATDDFSELDVARAQLIHDLRRMGVNDEGVPVILDLIDQLHGLRRMLRELLAAVDADPDLVGRRGAGGTADSTSSTQLHSSGQVRMRS